MMKNDRYDIASRLFHWSMAVVIIYATIAGYTMHLVIDSSPSLWSILSVMNMSLATITTPILLARWCWKYFRPSVYHRVKYSRLYPLARMTHSMIYFLMFLVFISGYLMLEESYKLFWLINIPNLIEAPQLNSFFFLVHRIGCIALSGFVIAHMLAAIYHHFWTGNNVLKLMWSSKSN
ncbi:cytochrome b/b6 domain-containing protein [Vibrio mediterranei]|uniref:cytochrome b n=1 Tax=Vibrio mediterranei TaxID=689 RepID=UPI0038CF07B8